uniref:Uncharacterized protein n=1 Tax=Acanthochromis polyacanthus TaxID=80966 RepID=A0A3Q1F4I7_9TELE
MLPSDEIWLCDLDSGTWRIGGDVPPDLDGFCGANIDETLYVFGGRDAVGYSNQMFVVDLSEVCCSWRKLTDTKGTTPSPRNKHSCWVHRDRSVREERGDKVIRVSRRTPGFSTLILIL